MRLRPKHLAVAAGGALLALVAWCDRRGERLVSVRRDELAEIINDGQNLLALAGKEEDPVPEGAAQEWIDATREWLVRNFDELVVACFNSNAGVKTLDWSKRDPDADTKARRSVVGSLHFRVRFLRDLAREL